METPTWIAELSPDERNRIDNGIFAPLDTYALGRARQAYAAVVEHLRSEHAEQLHAELERESVRLAERAAEIERLRKARAG